MTELHLLSPAGLALVKIGVPAVPPVLATLEAAEDPDYPGRQCTAIIAKVLGRDLTRHLLRDELARANDERERANLTAALEYLGKVKDAPSPLSSER